MAKIAPFKGIRYNQKKVKINKVVAPPYDVISKKEQDGLYEKSDYNIVRLILGKEKKGDTSKKNKYSRAGSFFNDWQNKDVLIQEETPVLYVYKQDFVFDGKSYSRFGFMSLLKIEKLFKGTVYPHERTLSKPKADRLNLMKASNANFSHIFGLYDDSKGSVAKILKRIMVQKAIIDFKDWNKERNRVWVIDNEKDIKAITKFVANKKVFIADGHHRYDTAGNFSKENKGKKKTDHVMVFLCNMNDKGLAVFPTHRLVKLKGVKTELFINSLEKYFSVKKMKQKDMQKELDKEFKKKNTAFSLYINNEMYLLVLKSKAVLAKLVKGSKAYRELDVAVLEEIIFRKVLKFSKKDIAEQKYIKYVKDLKQSMNMVKNKEYTMAFLMNPTRVSEIRSVALNGEVMPQKSTYFYPKLLTGLVINKFE